MGLHPKDEESRDAANAPQSAVRRTRAHSFPPRQPTRVLPSANSDSTQLSTELSPVHDVEDAPASPSVTTPRSNKSSPEGSVNELDNLNEWQSSFHLSEPSSLWSSPVPLALGQLAGQAAHPPQPSLHPIFPPDHFDPHQPSPHPSVVLSGAPVMAHVCQGCLAYVEFMHLKITCLETRSRSLETQLRSLTQQPYTPSSTASSHDSDTQPTTQSEWTKEDRDYNLDVLKWFLLQQPNSYCTLNQFRRAYPWLPHIDENGERLPEIPPLVPCGELTKRIARRRREFRVESDKTMKVFHIWLRRF